MKVIDSFENIAILENKTKIDAIVEVAEVATHEITKSGSDVQIELVDLRSSGVVHTDIIGTGSADLREAVDSAPTVHPRRPWV